jgi:hypothetical protein
LARAVANSSTEAVAAGAAGEPAGRELEVLVGVAVSVQPAANKAMATHVRASEISFI